MKLKTNNAMETIKTNRITTVNANSILIEAETELQNGRYESALHQFNTYLLFEPFNHDALLKKGLCYLYLENFDQAYAMFEMVLNEDEQSSMAFYCLAEYYKAGYDFEMAEQLILHAIGIDETSANYMALAAEIYFHMKQYDTAYDFINRAIVLNPGKKEFYYWRALLLFKFEKFSVSISDLNRAISMSPNYFEAFRLRARCRMLLNEVDSALLDLREAQKYEQLNRAA
jgi:tetratricopeptide (TPR) repeat protein